MARESVTPTLILFSTWRVWWEINRFEEKGFPPLSGSDRDFLCTPETLHWDYHSLATNSLRSRREHFFQYIFLNFTPWIRGVISSFFLVLTLVRRVSEAALRRRIHVNLCVKALGRQLSSTWEADFALPAQGRRRSLHRSSRFTGTREDGGASNVKKKQIK